MSEENTTQAATNAATSPTVAPKSLEERAADLFGREAPPAAEATEATTEAPAATEATEPDANAQRRAARRAELAELARKERERVDLMAALRERDQLKRENEELRERTKAYESHIDPKKLTKEQFFALAENNPDLTPHELGEWLRERMANPELAAARAARTAVDPEIAALRKQNEELAAQINGFVEQHQTAAQEAAERHAESQLVEFVGQVADSAPTTAFLLKNYGPEEFLKIARSAARTMPPHAGPQALLDEIEEALSRVPWLNPTANQRRQASVPSSAVPVAQGGITNTLAQQRSSVVDENANFARLTLEERAARIFEQ